ncbi:glycosyltransferase [Vibrio tasmaniensis]|uniref:glycosyltransferase n=1 Tax=Vibrio tasmaniensis TaxID=212663 RepID=UPI00107F041A|nr:glycosyltransferase [Vibrio tasmaniensis]
MNKDQEIVDENKKKYEDLILEHKLLQKNHNKLKSNYGDLLLLLNKPYIRAILKIAKVTRKVPFSVAAFNLLKRCKHHFSETMEGEATRVKSCIASESPKTSWTVSEKSVVQLKMYQKSDDNLKKYAVVSALYGNSDQLMLPLSIRDNFDYFCFSDQELDTYGLWEICQSPYYSLDPTRMARYVKTHLHSLLPEYDGIIWCDANIRFDDSIYAQFDKFIMCESDARFIQHPHRNCIYEEAEACIQLNKDNGTTIKSQISNYRKMGIPKDLGMFETGLYFIKPNNEKVNKFYTFWWKEIVNGSKRDQLSIIPAIEYSNISVKLLLESGVCVRSFPGTEIIPHKKLKHMSSPSELKEFKSKSKPKPKLCDSKVNDTLIEFIKSDVIICVYNALEDVKLCFDSVVKHSYESVNNIIFVNDFSNDETSDYLNQICKEFDKVCLINNVENLGYTKSANVGLSSSNADFRVILNSDTIVTKDWLTKLTSIAFSSENIGIVGPISNAAGSQSVPSTKGTTGQTAINILPEGYTIDNMNDLAEANYSNVFPAVPLIHGFCIGIKSSVIEKIGYFDDINFARYYGEENDYCLRAFREGFDLVVATNTYIFHSKSKSIEEEERILHMSKAGQRLRDIYGKQEMRDYCIQLEDNPNLIATRKYFDYNCYN